ncbi:MAG: NhaP-type Na+/H+ or K+/H+ antiporter [Planctomycetota bacterium]|jgi:NhaP-type Na+/H+ or K+/H+ antiporter
MHDANPLLTITCLLGAGAAMQWLAWRMRVPAILFLLLAGFLIGPVFGWFAPEDTFGELFRPIVSLAVGIILFEGGLTLRFRDLRGVGRVVTNLCSIGALVTWLLTTLAGIWIVGVEPKIALLVGAILVLTGPTVVIPLVRHVRPRAPLGPILRWEGILIDPIGAVLALLVLEAITGHDSAAAIATGIGKTVVYGGALGATTGWLLARALERLAIPDRLHVPVTFGAVGVAFAVANTLQPEAGLLAVTVMGIVLANRSKLDIEHVLEWHEPLVTMLLALLFVTISARLELESLTKFGLMSVVFTAALILIVRPAAVALSTLGTSLNWRDRGFLMAMAPRGIVVAAVSSEFSLHLEHVGEPGAQDVIAMVFPAIVLTVVAYGFLARPFARLIGTAQADPQGAILVGADLVSRELGQVLKEQGFEVLLVDTNHANTTTARTSGLRTFQGSVLSHRFTEEAELDGIGNMIALTPSDEINRLALEQFVPTFGRAHLFRVASSNKKSTAPHHAGRELFATDLDTYELRNQLNSGARIRATKLTDQFGPDEYREQYGDQARPLFLVTADKKLQIVTTDNPPVLKVGQTVLGLVSRNFEAGLLATDDDQPEVANEAESSPETA